MHEQLSGGRVRLSTIPESRRLFARRRFDRADRIALIGCALAAAALAAFAIAGWLA